MGKVIQYGNAVCILPQSIESGDRAPPGVDTMELWKLLIVLLLLSAIPLAALIHEKLQNERDLKKLKIRVNVNGIRGKSTITRMIFSILREAGYQVVGKTTGTAARMFYWDQAEEEELVRRPRGVSISEQIRVIHKAVKRGANALVCECMAVRPDYQIAYQHHIIKADVLAIVNVLEDHLDEMGPTLEQLAWAFADTIPYHGVAVVPDCEFTDYFRKIARERDSRIIVVNPEIISQEYLGLFPYKVFDNNCAMALGVARALGIDDETSLRGMLKATPDPGALQVIPLRREGLQTWFVNAFAANEPASTLEIWEYLHEEKIPMEMPVVVMNCRPDRVDRSYQFARDCLPHMGPIKLVVIGEMTAPIRRAYRRGKLRNVREYRELQGKSVKEIMDVLVPMLDGHVLVGVGNIHGIGEEFIEALYALDEEGQPGVFARASDPPAKVIQAQKERLKAWEGDSSK